MEEVLKHYYTSLKEIRTYLIKIGPKRRTSSQITNVKLEEANVILRNFEKDFLDDEVKLLCSKDLGIINKYTEKIKLLFVEIKNLCTVTKEVSSVNMAETFDLKTAVSLLPVMDDTENVTKQLISSIEMYNSMLDDSTKQFLVQFVLKTRLSESAKLRLSQSYASVDLLINDMKKHLLTKKSFTALQSQLLRCTQNQKSIEDYGKEIEQLFVELTISQADGSSSKYEILKPINEKTAINRFATGLRNGHLSTIITARNYATLKDAIRGAQDGQTSASSEEGIMHLQRRYHKQFPNRSYTSRGQRSRGRGGYSPREIRFENQRGHPTTSANHGSNQGFSRSRNYEHSTSQGHRRPNRGTYSTRTYNRGRTNFNNPRVQFLSSEEQQQSTVGTANPTETDFQFFRE